MTDKVTNGNDTPAPEPDMSPDKLLASLEKLFGGDQLLVEDGMVMILEPGVTVSNLSQLFEEVFSELSGLSDIFPATLPLADIRLSSLSFMPKTTEHPFLLDFTLGWPSGQWEIIPGILKLENPEFRVSVQGGLVPGQVETTAASTSLAATVYGVVDICQIPFTISIKLPEGYISARMVQPGDTISPYDEKALLDKSPQPTALLQQFQVGGNQTPSPGFDIGSVALQDLTVIGNIPARHLLLHLGLGEIKLGPGTLNTQLTVDYTGGDASQVSGQIWGQYNIHKKDSSDPLFALMLMAAYDGPGKSWKFEGGAVSSTGQAVKISELIEVFTDTGNLPGVFDKFGIKYLGMTYETGTENFTFQCDVEVDDLFPIDANVEMIVDVALHKQGNDPGASYSKTFSGRLLFRLENNLTLEFDLVFDQSSNGKATDTKFIAAYKNPVGGDLNIGELIAKIEPGIDIPLSIKLEDAFFIYDVQGNQKKYLFGLDIGGGLDLAGLPLVGKILPKDASLNFGLQPLIAGPTGADPHTYFTADELAHLTGLIPGGKITLPAQDITTPIDLSIHLALGKDITFDYVLPVKLNSQKKAQPNATSAAPAQPIAAPTALNPPAQEVIQTTDQPVATSPAAAGVTPAPDGSSDSGIQWINVGKKFGPVQFNRLGLQFEAETKMVWAYLDASLSLSVLTFTLQGLGMGTPINKLDPHFRLSGIGIDYKSGPVEIGASFLHTVAPESKDPAGQIIPAYDEYSGLATIKTPTLSLSAIGSYSDLPAFKSLFIYAVLNDPIGGPSFFFVTGLAAGFGFNRKIIIPEVSKVGQFPLVNMAVGGAGSAIPALPSDRTSYIHDILNQLRTSIVPANGEYFLAVGIHFTSFQLIDSFVLLMVSFGEHFEVDVLGLSTVTVPAPIPGGQDVTPIAEFQLALKAVFNPAEGILSVEAQLTANSYILDRNCHLTGGFAFFSWFNGPHQGDFVLSLGGYHPNFQKPDHYPIVPRLGLNWQVTSELSITGGIYFALLPHMLMAGGQLSAVYQSGSTKATFTLAADFLISWKPYHYDARVWLDIKVEYTYHLFGTHHISASVGAEIHIWGPEFAGHANLHLACLTLDLDFGAGTTPKLEPVDWKTFCQSFLPKEASKMVQMAVMNGLVRTDSLERTDFVEISKLLPADSEKMFEQHVINPQDFQLGINLVVPYKTLKISPSGPALSLAQVQQVVVRGTPQLAAFINQGNGFSQVGGRNIQTGAFGIAPMARQGDSIDSTLQLSVQMEDVNGQLHPVDEFFGFRPVFKRIPRALWGENLQADLNGEKFVENVLSGLEVVSANPPRFGETHWIEKEKLQYLTSTVDGAITFEPISNFVATDYRSPEAASRFLQQNLTDSTTMKNRQTLLGDLGFDYDRLGLKLFPDIFEALLDVPQIGMIVNTQQTARPQFL